jgi:EAL domain-containing protein (putative c-di-GMP-specific phosphodiesterase class I)
LNDILSNLQSVEDEAALRALTEIGVDYAQGLHIAPAGLLSEISSVQTAPQAGRGLLQGQG